MISVPLGPLAVIVGAGSGKSETMAVRLIWLVANSMVRPDFGQSASKNTGEHFACCSSRQIPQLT